MCICGGLAGSSGGLGIASTVDPGEFKDNPEAYAGRTIQLEVQYFSRNPIRDLRRIHDEMGKPEYDIEVFRISRSAGATLTVPTELAVPALEYADSIYITFRCTKGSTDEGNIVTHIRREN